MIEVEFKNKLLKVLNKELKSQKIEYDLTEKQLNTLILDVTRIVDNQVTAMINDLKKTESIKISSAERNDLRKYILGYHNIKIKEKYKLNKIKVSTQKLSQAFSLVEEGFKRNEQVMRKSLIARLESLVLNNNEKSTEKYFHYIQEKQKNNVELIIINIEDKDGLSSNNIAQIIEENYKKLSNYHHMILIFKFEESKVNWKKLSDIAIFMENFRQEKNFNLYNKNNKQKRIDELIGFVEKHKHIKKSQTLKTDIKKFYNYVSYGFQFKDLFITSDASTQILVMQKVELDEEPVKCPVCLVEEVRGNSYSKILFKSFECTNPSCSARSKIGRGKRFDLLAAKRQVYLDMNADCNKVNEDTYISMRRDIIEDSNSLIEKFISIYTWTSDSVILINSQYDNSEYKKRKIKFKSYPTFDNKLRISKLPILKIFKQFAQNISFVQDDTSCIKIKTIDKSTVINYDSTTILPYLSKLTSLPKVNGAITSPPYYNAREYSQWVNFFCYLVDMMINAKAVYDSMDENGVYIYNVGDVVGQDNVYINSSMSKRRQMLGFYSVFVFELVGFKIFSNCIWDKGEVQSKRNSTSNLFAGYINPINSYEHCLVFSKNKQIEIIPSEVKKINAVKKINSKGKNILGHTAPYPADIPRLLLPYLSSDSLVLDPYLGSGTTSIVMQEENIHNLGFEICQEYFLLACQRIEKSLSNKNNT